MGGRGLMMVLAAAGHLFDDDDDDDGVTTAPIFADFPPFGIETTDGT